MSEEKMADAHSNFLSGNRGCGAIDGEGGLMKYRHDAYVSIQNDQKRAKRKEYELVVAEAFQYYDKDQSGYLDRSEIKAMLQNSSGMLGKGFLTDEAVENIISSFDINADGKISY